MARRYALGFLLRNLKRCYKGDLTIIGNPRIKPYDVVFVMDSESEMTGPIEVRQSLIPLLKRQDSSLRCS